MQPEFTKRFLRLASSAWIREFYLLKNNKIRIIELFYWPTVNVGFWYLISSYTLIIKPDPQFSVSIILMTCCWEAFLRSHQSLALGFQEEIWFRNIPYLFTSAAVPHHWLLGLVGVAMTRGLVAATVAFAAGSMLQPQLALHLPLLSLAIVPLGLAGAGLGLLIVAVFIRVGIQSQAVVWMTLFVAVPFSCIYYPVALFPLELQIIAHLLPTTQVFETLRATLAGASLSPGRAAAVLLHAALTLAVGWGAALWSISWARRSGAVTRQFFKT
jgi:ABC-2 type transport system permease protein